MIKLPVTLVSPSGTEEVVTSFEHANNLLLRAGYKVKAPAEPAKEPENKQPDDKPEPTKAPAAKK